MRTVATFTDHTFAHIGDTIEYGSVALDQHPNGHVALTIFDDTVAFAHPTADLSEYDITAPNGHMYLHDDRFYQDIWKDLHALGLVGTPRESIIYSPLLNRAVLVPLSPELATTADKHHRRRHLSVVKPLD